MPTSDDINRSQIASLEVDIKRDTSLHARLQAMGHEGRPRRADFIQKRLQQLYGDDAAAASRALTIITELDAFDAQFAFDADMRSQIDLAPVYSGLGNLSITDQLGRIQSEAQPVPTPQDS